MKVWITKYALTQGIQEDDARDFDDDIIRIDQTIENGCYQFPQYFHKGEWFKTKEEAIQKAEEMRLKKIKSLEKQLNKFRQMEFK